MPIVIEPEDRIGPEHLQTVLLHLHDLGFLASDPTVSWLIRKVRRRSISSGLQLRTLLLDLIESLRPTHPYDITAPDWRHYIVLSDRYVKRRPLWEIQQRLALGERQMRREHQRALAALSMLLEDRDGAPLSPLVESDSAPLAAAVQRLTPSPSHVRLQDLFEDVAHILTRTRSVGASFHVHIDPPALMIYTDRGILHQLLLKLAQCCIAPNSNDAGATFAAAQQDGRLHIRFDSPCDIQPQAQQEHGQLCELLARALGSQLDWQANSVSFALPIGPRTRTVLIVDDEPAALELFRSYLTGVQCEVVTESRAENVLPCVTATWPDLVMLDIMMPAMDGWEVLQRLRHMPAMRDVPIVACSVLNDAEMAYALGAARFLKKPVLRHQLVHVVNELLNVTGEAAE
jgi:CheY-like chemotaxis protein